MNEKSRFPTFRNRSSGARGFWLAQAAILAVVLGCVTYRVTQLRADWALPAARNEPLSVPPLYDYPDVVSDQQLRAVLRKLVPRFDEERIKINHVDHALRFWGLAAEFDDPGCLSGQAMRRILLDHRRFAQVWDAETPPLLIDTGAGVRVRVQEGLATASHVDHTLAVQAEVGTPLDFLVWTTKDRTTLRAMLEQSLRDFSLNQAEYEWSTLAYALYLPPATRWLTSEGQQVTFDRLAARIMRERLPRGVCYGNHRMHTLVMLLRIDEQVPILSDSGRAEIFEYLHAVTKTLVENQQPNGSWTRAWPGQPAENAEDDDQTSYSPLMQQLIATGHPLEWWALAPKELHPPREVLTAAAQWLCQTIESLTPEQVEEFYTPLSHVGRALALWRGREPAEVPLAD